MRTLPVLLSLTACGGLTTDDLDAAIAEHAAVADAHGAYATADDLDAAAEAAVADHDDDPSAHGGPFATPAEVADALATHAVTVDQLPVRRHTESVSIYATFPENGTVFETGGFGNSGLRLPDNVTAKFAFSLVVPEGFTGTSIDLDITWRTPDTDCDMALVPNYIDRARVGSPRPGGAATAGFSGPAATMSAPTTAWITETSRYTVTEGGGLPGLLPGDAINLSLFRARGGCTGDLWVTGISWTWEGP